MARRNIVVSGGSKGLGEAIVRHFLDGGDAVATFSRKPTPFIENTQQPRRAGPVSQRRRLRCHGPTPVRRRGHTRFGHVDALINNAGIAHDGVLALMSEDRIDQMLDTNLRASLILAKECARLMLLRGKGRIVSISSIIAENGFSGRSAYAATKAGQLGIRSRSHGN